jgi:hypothetical protein
VSIAEAEGHISKWGLTEGQYDVSADHPGQNWRKPDDQVPPINMFKITLKSFKAFFYTIINLIIIIAFCFQEFQLFVFISFSIPSDHCYYQ